jgi:hypothetical protein
MMSHLQVLDSDRVARPTERIAPRIREWSDEWLDSTSGEALHEELRRARNSLAHVSQMHQLTARLIWEVRIERIEKELKRRAQQDDNREHR